MECPKLCPATSVQNSKEWSGKNDAIAQFITFISISINTCTHFTLNLKFHRYIHCTCTSMSQVHGYTIRQHFREQSYIIAMIKDSIPLAITHMTTPIACNTCTCTCTCVLYNVRVCLEIKKGQGRDHAFCNRYYVACNKVDTHTHTHTAALTYQCMTTQTSRHVLPSTSCQANRRTMIEKLQVVFRNNVSLNTKTYNESTPLPGRITCNIVTLSVHGI